MEGSVSGGGPHADLDAWVLATAPHAVAYARSLLRDSNEADDIVQDCYCRLLAKAQVYNLPRDGLQLLLRAITNASINARVRRKPLLRLVRTDERGEETGSEDPPDRSAVAPELNLMHQELRDAVAAGLLTLPPQQRAALELKSIGHTQQEIGDILGITPVNAGVLVYRARQALAAYLAPFLGGEAVS
jgi:RNA polymerase sigma factor (sigma-70 family)